jgi:hypothetical protein
VTATVEGLGPLVDLAKALGIVGSDDQLDPTWFSDPGGHVGKMLREPTQRGALLRAADKLLAQGAPPEVDAQGRHWIPLVEHGGVTLCLVVTGATGSTEIAAGARLTTTSPESHVHVLVPLLHVPASGPATVAVTTGDGRVLVDADLRLAGGPPPTGEAGLAGIVLHADVKPNGTDPHLAVTLRGLQLPGQAAPNDVGLGGPLADLGDQALRLVFGLVQQSLAGASGELAELLALVGVGADSAIPALPVADLVARDGTAWARWLDSLLADPAAVAAWLGHVRDLVGHGATVSAPAGSGLPGRVEWILAGGLRLALVLVAGRDATGTPVVELGVEARLDAAGTPPGGLHLRATLTRITLGATPSALGLPELELTGRVGRERITVPADRLIALPDPSPRVGSLRAGIALGPDRRARLVLAVYDVEIGTHPYPVLDLTNTQTLADVSGTAVSGIGSAVLGMLGAAGDAVKVLLGLTAPAGQLSWPVALTTLPALLADPVGALVAYHDRVLRTHRPGYAAVLDPLRVLLTAPGFNQALSGTGDLATPWRLPVAGGVALLAWTQGSAPVRLHLGVTVEHTVTDLGGGCPTVALTLTGELAEVALDGSGGHALPGARAGLTFGARGGVPLRLGDQDAALVADSAGVELAWAPGMGLTAALRSPGLGAQVDGETVPFALPTLAGDGTLAGQVPWRALELLAGHVLTRTGLSWADELAELAGWRPGTAASGTSALALEALVADPLGTLRGWVEGLARERRLEELARRLALVLGGEAAAGLGAGVYHGRGTAGRPLVVPLRAASVQAARRAELLLWTGDPDPDPGPFRPGALLGWLTAPQDAAGEPPSAAQLAAALHAGARGSDTLAAALLDRDDLATGLDGLAARWVDTDGLVGADDAVLDGAVVHDLDGVTHAELAGIDLVEAAGVPLGAGTVVASGPLGPTSWPEIADDHVLDLRAAGLVPSAFDISAVAGGTGPWLVLLPTRADAATAAGDDGAARQAERLARVVDAVVAAVDAAVVGDEDVRAPVVLAGFGAAGHAAVTAAAHPGVDHLVTVGTAHGGVGLDVLEAQPAAGALNLLAALLPAADPDRPELDAVRRGRGLLAPLLAAAGAPGPPLADLLPPAGGTPPEVPETVEVHCVRGHCDATAVWTAIAGLVVRGLQDAYESLPARQAGEEGLGLGVGLTVAPPAAPGAVRVEVSLALTAGPGLRARIGVGRAAGWLAGGPDPARPAGVNRHPSLRRADIELDLPAAGTAAARIVLHDASALGVSRTRWVVSHTDPDADPLLPEARVLVGRLAAALGPLPAAGAIRQVVDLLAALGLTDPGTVPATGGPVGLSVEGVRRLLVDPAGLLADAVPATVAKAVAALLGAPAPSEQAPTVVTATVDDLTVHLDLAARTVRAEVAGLATATGLRVTGSVELRTDRTLASTLSLGFGAGSSPNGRAVLELDGPPLRALLRWEGGGAGLPAQVQLAPMPDRAGLARLLTAVAPAGVLWAGISFLRELQAGTVALVDPVLAALGLLDGGRVVVPLGLLNDPGHWLRHGTVLGVGGHVDGARVGALVDALGGLLGLASPRPGAWTLPYGLELESATSAGRTRLALRLAQPIAGTGLRVAGSLGLVLAETGLPAVPAAQLTLALPDGSPLTSAGRVVLTVGPAGLEARLVLPGSGVDLKLLPDGPGLASLGGAAAAAATYALPLVLDTLVDLPASHPAKPVGTALGAFGDATGLRSGGRFQAAELQLLAGAPAQQLAERLRRNLPAALDGLAGLLAPALPAGYSLARSGSDLVFGHTGTVTSELRLAVPASGGIPQGARVTGSVGGVVPFTGAKLAGGLTVDPAGLAEAHASFAVDHASGLVLGPLTLAPVAEVAIGAGATGGPRIAAGLAVDATRQVRGVLRLGQPAGFALEATGGTLPQVLGKLLLPVAADLALSTAELQALLNRTVLGGPQVRELLDGVLFTGGGAAFDPAALDETKLWGRLLRLARNVAGHSPSIAVGPLTVATAKRTTLTDDVYGIAVSLRPGERFNLVGDGVTVDVEVDDSWITGPAGKGGITLELLQVASGSGTPAPFFGVAVRGVGVRVGRSGAPLLATFLTVDSVALHGYLAADSTNGVTDAGGELELGGLRIGLGAATGGGNKVAAGVLRDSASGPEKPEPRFSPALSVERHPGGPARVGLRAGSGDGPWWMTVQRSFGPVYIEQVGFGVTRAGNKVLAARVMVDGKVSLLGLVVAVDDLAVGGTWPQGAGDPPPWSPLAWEIGLAGLAVAADTGGVRLTGGLRKAPGMQPDYVGMIGLRLGVYGLSAYGGYGVITDKDGDYTSLFIFGALNAPIGGPPAFFVTGIGAGVGINRLLLLPADLGQFPSYPLLQALDRSSPMANPETALASLRTYFPPARGAFWFAAGVSFTSFTLIDGIAVLGVAVGDGLDISLLGLARAAQPTTAFPLIQVELALLARFSTRSGVLWVQAQLTDNSFLLTRDCRLTGGFAFVLWFTGDKAGECVLTLGGFHPSFHRDGYPVVPRLGFVWGVSDILVVKGESYFALTSEAIMIGARIEASLTAGPLWAYLRLGADGIVFFDPFHFQVTAFAELGAGITIDIDLGWFGHIRKTISVHRHAAVLLEGPEFRGRATIDLDVASATIAFGDWSDRSTPALGWADFERKYLRPGGAEPLTVVTGRGTLPPGAQGSRKAPTGAAGDPFLVLPEFELTVTTAAAASAVTAGSQVQLPFPVFLAIGPMQLASTTSTLSVSIRSGDDTEWVQTLDPAVTTGTFPKGVWAAQPQSEPTPIPVGDTVDAASGVRLIAEASIPTGTVPIDYRQVEIGRRHQLPFLSEAAVRGQRAADVGAAAVLEASTASDVPAVLATARAWLTGGPRGRALSPLGAAVFASARAAPPQLVPLTHGMAVDPDPPPTVPHATAGPGRQPPDTRAHPLAVDALLMATPIVAVTSTATSVGARGDGLARVAPSTIAEVRGRLDPRLALRLVTAGASAAPGATTVLASGAPPFTGRAGAGGELRLRPGTPPWQARRLAALTKGLRGEGVDLHAGELAVLTTANGAHDVEERRPALRVTGGLPVRVVAMDAAGAVTRDALVTGGAVLLPPLTERVAVVGGAGRPDGAAGWHGGAQFAQVGARTLLGPGCTVSSSALRTRRGGRRVAAAFVTAADAVAGYALVTTRLPAGTRSVALVLERAERVDDERGDALDLGLSGATRPLGPDGAPLPAHVILSGSRTVSVYDVVPEGGADAVEVTVASGEHVHLGGVLGSRTDAADLVEALRARELAGTLGALVTTPSGSASVRWLDQEHAPSDDEGLDPT